MDIYTELREATLAYMASHNLSQVEMGERLGVRQPTIRNWAFDEQNPSVLNPELMEKLVALLREDGLVVTTILAPKAIARARRSATKQVVEQGKVRKGTGRPRMATEQFAE